MSYLLVSLHDVTPAHRARLIRAEQMFTRLRVPHVTYLYVPRFHGRHDACDDSEFVRWCAEPRPFGIQWFLHGYYHQDDRTTARVAWRTELARRFLTSSEGEFAALDEHEAGRRLDAGMVSFHRALGGRPAGFVAPAWLWPKPLANRLLERGFRYTEDHFSLYDLYENRRVDAPAITWATRSWWRRLGSTVVCPQLARRWMGHDVIRLAVHPLDFDHPGTTRSIERVLSRLLSTRTVVSVGEWCFKHAS